MIGILSNDERYVYLSKILDNSILSLDLSKLINLDSLLLPLGGINNDGYIINTNIKLIDILNNNNIKIIYVGNSNKVLDELQKIYKFKLIELLKNEVFIKENAYLTSKGLLYILNNKNIDLNKRILLLGYGNISFYLAKLLNNLNKDFNIFTSNLIERKYLLLEGYKYANLSDIDKFDIVINTIPFNLEYDFNKLKNKLYIDISSYPYGISKNNIDKYNINYELISNIPSKYDYKLAALLIKKYLIF